MATWYEVWYSMCRIKEVDVVKSSDKTVTIRTMLPKLDISQDMKATKTTEMAVSDRRVNRIGSFYSYFPTRQEARQHLIDHCTKQLGELRARAKRAEADLEKALGLPPC